MICSPKTENKFKCVCPLLTQSSIMISGTYVYSTLFLASSHRWCHEVQNVEKSDFLGPCSFIQLFNNVEKLRRKPKIFVKIIQIFWYVQHVGVIFFFKCTRSSQSCNFGKSLKCWKNLSMLGKPQGKKSSSTLDICLTALAPPLCIFGHVQGTFFSSPIWSRQKFLKKFGFLSGSPLFSWKMSKLYLNRFLIRFEFDLPPFLKNVQTQAKKKFSEEFQKSWWC